MIERPSADLQRQRARSIIRNTIRTRGPDRGKDISRLTERGGRGRAEALESSSAVTAGDDAVIITASDGNPYFTIDLSKIDGTDEVA